MNWLLVRKDKTKNKMKKLRKKESASNKRNFSINVRVQKKKNILNFKIEVGESSPLIFPS